MRRLSVQRHQEWRIKLAQQQQAVAGSADLIDDDLIEVDPYNGDPPSKRKDAELDRVLALLDSLGRGNG